MLAPQIEKFYFELANPLVTSALCLVHQRFSTNTFPSWKLAHPYRYVAHNGEINTVRGNVSWMNARQSVLASPLYGDKIEKLFPVIMPGGSDSASLDNAVEFLFQAGRSLPHVMAMLIPEAWAGNPDMDEDKRAFYEYHASLMEPWDGPAAIAFTDGRVIGATLDRNGLRPAATSSPRTTWWCWPRKPACSKFPPKTCARRAACSRAACSWSIPCRSASSPTPRSRSSSPRASPTANG